MPALEDFSLHVKQGETVALVGASGAGKSTVLNLLLRFYDATSGDIKIDTCPHTNLALEELRDQFGLVGQDATIFSTSIRENIRYARPEASDEEVMQAAKRAYAHEFITDLPESYATQVGEKGVRLSGGQRQRLAIARAILKNPEIFLLDEATSQLDAKSEQKVQQAIENISKGRTTLVVAHRLATIKNADRIVVMDKGKIIAQGTHTDLLKTSKLYASLAELQFLG